ncbi:uncharacterized protein TRUGW13939_06652 [Talaromyces rugulosus]|uniref:Uncharacterized protein n=1 Tax=Talaromyces rugulosus TaxID=121627 RepID=A0A7H8R0M3_TALRU|nr:uncharacterized protein TRUGW13939_06652 [Talaromyces rugulosus]QKX59518.1 hypothetical protein TRUGW13939_06652 [Talaromyces rugulosus]
MPRPSNAPQRPDSAGDDLVFVQEEYPPFTMPQQFESTGSDLVFVQDRPSAIRKCVPTQWPDLYADSEAEIPTSDNTEYGPACFFMMFVACDSEDPTFAAIMSGFSPTSPLYIPRGAYKLRVEIFSKPSQGELFMFSHPIEFPKGSYTEKHNINFTGDFDSWQIVVTNSFNSRTTTDTFFRVRAEEYKITPPKATATMAYSSSAPDPECTIAIQQGLTHIKLRAEIWCDIKHMEVALPVEEQFQQIPVELDVWVKEFSSGYHASRRALHMEWSKPGFG